MSTTIAATLLLVPASVAGAATIKVTTTADDFGGATECSLREAVTAANFDAAYGGCKAGSGADEIRLQSGSVYVRSIDGNGEDGNATGDLDVTSKVTIGPRKGRATIDALGFDRVLEVLPGADLTLSRVTLTGATETYPPNVVDGMGVRNTGGKLKTSRVKIIGNRTLGNSANNGGGLVIAGGKTILDPDHDRRQRRRQRRRGHRPLPGEPDDQAELHRRERERVLRRRALPRRQLLRP